MDPKPNAILIVDDDISMQEYLGDIMRSHFPDCQIEIANNGVEAMRNLRAHKIDLLLLDVRLPLMNGDEILEKIIRDKKIGQCPILIITGLEARDASLEIFHMLQIPVLFKPFKRGELIQLAEKELAAHAQKK